MNCKQTREAIDTASRLNPYGNFITSHLSGCPDCRHHADETNSLLMLLGAQPRVEAPADFDFKLRARIARAQAEQSASATTLQSLLQKIWAQTFSWGQAATAMAAVALAVTCSTFYFNHDNGDNGATPNSGTVAVLKAPVNPVSSEINAPPKAADAIKLAPVKLTSRNTKVTPAAFNSEARTNSISSNDIASLDKSSRVYSSETRQFVPDRNLYGAEAVSVNSAKSAVNALTF